MQILGQIFPQTIWSVLISRREERYEVKVERLTGCFLRIKSDGESVVAVWGKNTGREDGFKLRVVVGAEVAVEFHIGFRPDIICEV